MAVALIAPTVFTVPPLPNAVNTPVELNDNPEPIVTSPGAAVVDDTLPNKVPVVMFCILAYVTAELAIVVVNVPAVVVISPVSAGNLAAASVPVALLPDKLTALAVNVCPDKDK